MFCEIGSGGTLGPRATFGCRARQGSSWATCPSQQQPSCCIAAPQGPGAAPAKPVRGNGTLRAPPPRAAARYASCGGARHFGVATAWGDSDAHAAWVERAGGESACGAPASAGLAISRSAVGFAFGFACRMAEWACAGTAMASMLARAEGRPGTIMLGPGLASGTCWCNNSGTTGAGMHAVEPGGGTTRGLWAAMAPAADGALDCKGTASASPPLLSVPNSGHSGVTTGAGSVAACADCLGTGGG
mmetsp:Transcript_55706/g.172828  ORF Transcript_55706/g.172828 Transcript_55706/m.172828 type:complete len:245 (+) Transcript_55706:1-735(+)